MSHRWRMRMFRCCLVGVLLEVPAPPAHALDPAVPCPYQNLVSTTSFYVQLDSTDYPGSGLIVGQVKENGERMFEGAVYGTLRRSEGTAGYLSISVARGGQETKSAAVERVTADTNNLPVRRYTLEVLIIGTVLKLRTVLNNGQVITYTFDTVAGTLTCTAAAGPLELTRTPDVVYLAYADTTAALLDLLEPQQALQSRISALESASGTLERTLALRTEEVRACTSDLALSENLIERQRKVIGKYEEALRQTEEANRQLEELALFLARQVTGQIPAIAAKSSDRIAQARLRRLAKQGKKAVLRYRRVATAQSAP